MKSITDMIVVYLINISSFVLLNIADANEIVKLFGGIVAIIYTILRIKDMIIETKKKKNQ